MSESCFMPDIKVLVPDEWRILRAIRLSALRESPHAFLSTYQQEKAFNEARWRAEFGRGVWHAGMERGRPVSLLGCTQEIDGPAHERYLEYLWVSPRWRNKGFAHEMLTVILENLRMSGVRTAFLWVMDGNELAVRLYKRVGFASSNDPQPLIARPGRSEERMQLDLD